MNERSVRERGAHDRLQGRLLIGLTVLFFAPLGLSFYLYYSAWRPGGRVNAGDLIDPPRPLPSLALPCRVRGNRAGFLTHKWSLCTWNTALRRALPQYSLPDAAGAIGARSGHGSGAARIHRRRYCCDFKTRMSSTRTCWRFA